MKEYVERKVAEQAKPEFLNEKVESYEKAIYAKGWNDCNTQYRENILSIPAVDVVERKPITTNADKIRAMTDEELARIITDGWCELINCCYQIDQALYRTCDNNCEERVLDWLKQEVKENG